MLFMGCGLQSPEWAWVSMRRELKVGWYWKSVLILSLFKKICIWNSIWDGDWGAFDAEKCTKKCPNSSCSGKYKQTKLVLFFYLIALCIHQVEYILLVSQIKVLKRFFMGLKSFQIKSILFVKLCGYWCFFWLL